jgi:hypothetical protein
VCGLGVAGPARLRTGGGADAVFIDDSIWHAAALLTGKGPDVIHIEQGSGPAGLPTEFRGSVRLDTGRRSDRIVIGTAGETGRSARFSGRTVISGGRGSDVLDAGLGTDPNSHGNTFQRLTVRSLERRDS